MGELLRRYWYPIAAVGKPEAVKRTYEEAMGMEMGDDLTVSDALSGINRSAWPDGSAR